jgi:hypothetical protein
MKNEDYSLDFIDDLVAQEAANKELLAMSAQLKAEGKIAQRLSAAQKLFSGDMAEGTLASLRRAQSRAEALIEKLARFASKAQ